MPPRARNHRSARRAGSRFARETAGYLAVGLDDDRIEVRAPTGRHDRGDIAGVRVHGQRAVIEVKNVARWSPGEWLREAETERVNDGALAGLVVAKRVGRADPGDAVAMLTLRDLVALLTGNRPDDPDPTEREPAA